MQKVLIANRGEIAVRIIKTLKKMGIQSVAIYSDADKQALHVKEANESYNVGPAPSKESYLNIHKIIEIAKTSGCDAIHPGYGFLSENALFAEMLDQNNIKLIGPSAHSMRVMGDKLSAKQAVKKYDIPMVPGVDHAVSSLVEAQKIAENIGYPVLIKAAAGGGGKGMKLVNSSKEMEDMMMLAMSEAQASFGNNSVFVEKFVTNPRHIEIQILADSYGNTVHLNERECSIQRRHQKVIEEAPSCILTPEIRQRMGEAAVFVAKACHYEGAGTVEFLVDDNLNFYFLEMNTRLQVEHPVTECITGLDLVEQQIKIARGEQLSFTQDDIKINGHAIELRVYAEDPFNNFLPDINQLQVYRFPEGDGIRVDNGIEEGAQVPIYYDPMLAKLITFGPTRQDAINKMKQAIQLFDIEGIQSTLSFGAFVLNHPAFVSGQFDTNFVQLYWHKEEISHQLHNQAIIAAAIGHQLIS